MEVPREKAISPWKWLLDPNGAHDGSRSSSEPFVAWNGFAPRALTVPPPINQILFRPVAPTLLVVVGAFDGVTTTLVLFCMELALD